MDMRFDARPVFDRAALLSVGLALAALLAVHPALASLQRPSTTPIAWIAPEGVVQVSACVPTMGEHWAKPADLPQGPIYTVHQGRLIAIEYMLTQADFAAGKNWHDLTFRYWGQQLPIEHADVDFQPQGHEGFEVPHYDLHFYVVGHSEDREITCQP
jgi:hypothetical protein